MLLESRSRLSSTVLSCGPSQQTTAPRRCRLLIALDTVEPCISHASSSNARESGYAKVADLPPACSRRIEAVSCHGGAKGRWEPPDAPTIESISSWCLQTTQTHASNDTRGRIMRLCMCSRIRVTEQRRRWKRRKHGALPRLIHALAVVVLVRTQSSGAAAAGWVPLQLDTRPFSMQNTSAQPTRVRTLSGWPATPQWLFHPKSAPACLPGATPAARQTLNACATPSERKLISIVDSRRAAGGKMHHILFCSRKRQPTIVQ